MVSDLEVGVRLIPDESELDDIEDRKVNVGADQGAATTGGGGSGGNAAAGGFAGAEAGELLGKGGVIAGLLAGILSQLKPVTQFLKLIFRVLSLALLPAIQLLVVALRPLLTSLAKTTQAVESPGETIGAAAGRFQRESRQQPGRTLGTSLSAFPGISPQTGGDIGEITGNSIEAIQSVINQEPSSSDLSDEGKKNRQANLVKDMLELIP